MEESLVCRNQPRQLVVKLFFVSQQPCISHIRDVFPAPFCFAAWTFLSIYFALADFCCCCSQAPHNTACFHLTGKCLQKNFLLWHAFILFLFPLYSFAHSATIPCPAQQAPSPLIPVESSSKKRPNMGGVIISRVVPLQHLQSLPGYRRMLGTQKKFTSPTWKQYHTIINSITGHWIMKKRILRKDFKGVYLLEKQGLWLSA